MDKLREWCVLWSTSQMVHFSGVCFHGAVTKTSFWLDRNIMPLFLVVALAVLGIQRSSQLLPYWEKKDFLRNLLLALGGRKEWKTAMKTEQKVKDTIACQGQNQRILGRVVYKGVAGFPYCWSFLAISGHRSQTPADSPSLEGEVLPCQLVLLKWKGLHQISQSCICSNNLPTGMFPRSLRMLSPFLV